MKKFLIVLTIFVFSNAALYAQKKGKPDLKPFKEEIKIAKKGDSKAALLVGNVCKGDMYAGGEWKDYKKAQEWFSIATSGDAATKTKAWLGLFEIHWLGSYGIDKSNAAAQKALNNASQNADLRFFYDDKPNINLKNFFATKAKADSGSVDALLLLARYEFEYGISYDNALKNSSKASASPDALYLYDKWNAVVQAKRSTGNEQIAKNALNEMHKKYAGLGSSIAIIEYLKESATTNLAQYKLKTEEAQKLVESLPKNDLESTWKALFWLQKQQQGVGRFATLRLMSARSSGLDSMESAFSAAAVQEWRNLEKEVQNLEKFAETTAQRNLLKGIFALDLNAYRANFQGDIKPIVTLHQQLQHPDVKTLVGETLWQGYQKELLEKIYKVIAANNQPLPTIELYNTFKTNAWLNSLHPSYFMDIDSRLRQLGVDINNLEYYYEIAAIEKRVFMTLEEGRQHSLVLQHKINDPFLRGKLMAHLRKKVIADVLGDAPLRNKIEHYKHTLLNESWLQPEGTEKYFYYTSENPNWLSGQVNRRGTTYFYTAIRTSETGNTYELKISAVVGSYSNLVYSGTMKMLPKTADGLTLQVNLSRYEVYHWELHEGEYLQVFYPKTGTKIQTQTTGRMGTYLDKNHGYAPDFPYMKTNEFSEKMAIRATLQCFILEYKQALK